MKLQRAKITITGIAAALLLFIGMSATPALANGHAHGKGKQGHYLYQRNQLPHHRGSLSRSQNSRYYQKRDRGHQTRQRSHGSRLHSNQRYHAQRRHNSNRRHNNQHRGHASYRSNDIIGAVIGGAIIYHLGRKIIKH